MITIGLSSRYPKQPHRCTQKVTSFLAAAVGERSRPARSHLPSCCLAALPSALASCSDCPELQLGERGQPLRVRGDSSSGVRHRQLHRPRDPWAAGLRSEPAPVGSTPGKAPGEHQRGSTGQFPGHVTVNLQLPLILWVSSWADRDGAEHRAAALPQNNRRNLGQRAGSHVSKHTRSLCFVQLIRKRLCLSCEL